MERHRRNGHFYYCAVNYLGYERAPDGLTPLPPSAAPAFLTSLSASSTALLISSTSSFGSGCTLTEAPVTLRYLLVNVNARQRRSRVLGYLISG
jgi:hypothetical protein